MTDSRREFLGRVPVAALAAGLGGLAGCTATGRDGDTGNLPEYAGWLYDPTPILEVDNRLYATFDVASLYEHRDLLPEGLFSVLETVDDTLTSVDVPALGNVTAIAYTMFDHGAWSTNPESGVTLVAEGSFDADAIQAELGDLADVRDRGTHAGYALHSTAFEWDLGSLGEHEASLTVGTAESGLVLGATFDVEERTAETVTRAIDARRGEAATVGEAFDDAAVLLEELGDATVAVGLDVRREYLDNYVDADEYPELNETLKDVVGLGADLSFEGGDLQGDLVFVFVDADAAEDADVTGAVADADGTTPEEVSATTDGRVARITARIDPEELWNAHGHSDESDDDA